MAVAVKNRETTTTGLLDRLPVQIVLGVLYVLGCIGILFPLLNTLWWSLLPFDKTQVVGWALLVLAGLLLATGLVYLGAMLLGPKPPKGLRAGIFFGVIGVCLAALITLWVGLWVEAWLYASSVPGATAWMLGVGITLGVGVLLLVLLAKLAFDRRTEAWLATIEDQGWFSTTSYKKSQGVRVRRCTIVGILALAATGLYTLDQGLHTSAAGWAVHLPFTGQVTVTPETAGDVPELREKLDQLAAAGVEHPALVLDRFELHTLNQKAQAQNVKVTDPGEDVYKDPAKLEGAPHADELQQLFQENPELKGGVTFERGGIYPKDVVERERKLRVEKHQKLQELSDKVIADALVRPPAEEPIALAAEDVQYQGVTLLPHLRYTLPLILGALSLWLAWRVVNMPAFADFLIATEAEMNKVSWTTRKRLVQDTIVVLVTVVLLTIFLFLADTVWSQLLTGIGVLQPPPREPAQAAQEQPW
jgi:preprotein translocase SecE subunit